MYREGSKGTANSLMAFLVMILLVTVPTSSCTVTSLFYRHHLSVRRGARLEGCREALNGWKAGVKC